MDSLTQIVLGAAVGNEILGKKLGNKAILYGAIAGTIPDLDVLFGKLLDPITAVEIHRGFSHSVLFFLILSPLLALILTRLEKKKGVTFKEATFFWFFGLLTHALLDFFTTWGTQLLWPLEHRFSLQSIFVIDPMYTLPFLTFLLLSMRKKNTFEKRKFWNRTGLIMSTSYLFFTLFVQSLALQKFEKQLELNQVSHKEIVVKPSPFNIILWTTNIKVVGGYLIGDYSFLDTKPIQFQFIPTQNELLENKKNEPIIKQLKRLSEGWYCITEKNGDLLFNDLRFGLMNNDPNNLTFAFSYKIWKENNQLKAIELPNKNRAEAQKLLAKLWTRLKGN